jgi:hypothetical protein
MEQPRRAFHVGEEEGDRARREIAPHAFGIMGRLPGRVQGGALLSRRCA